MVRSDGVIKRPKLPPHLLKELSASDSSSSKRPGRSNQSQITSRKDRRKAERQQKKAGRGRQSAIQSRRAEKPALQRTNPPKPQQKTESKPVPSKRCKSEPESEEEDEEDLFADFDDGDDVLSDGVLDEGSDDEDDDEDEEGEDEEELPQATRKIPKTVKNKLDEDDAEIADLERRLGIKGKKKLPQSFIDDGLSDILGGLGGAEDEKPDKRKRKAEEDDDWLAQKRRKAEAAAQKKQLEPESEESGEDMDGLDEDMSDHGSDEEWFDEHEDDDEEGGEGDDFDDLDSEDEALEEPPAKKVRENPYVAPTTRRTAKYVPPSLRKETGPDSELAARVRRQNQGLLNRITESNLLSILGEIEKLYRDYPRQHVSSSLIDLLLIQVSDPTSLPDTLLILTAGFASAAYKVIGTDLGAQLIQAAVERFENYYAQAKVAALERSNVPKQTSNLITFISELYNFRLIGPNIIFDYIRVMLDDLSELNAELLLRIVRTCGPTLRQDDPMALKDIATLIPPAVAKYGEKNLTVRTKFMIETITDLKNNGLKRGTGTSAVVSEHLTRMKKTLGQLKSRKLKATEPLRIGLKDIKNADRTGKWWLVGSSWAGKSGDKDTGKSGAPENNGGSDDESITLDDGWDEGPDLLVLAKEQGMNTEVRRSIFVSVLSALDVEDAYLRLLKLQLNRDRKQEIAIVLLRCVGAEEHYNPYYSLVAKKMCENQRQVKLAFQIRLWKMLSKLGEAGYVDEDEKIDEDDREKELITRRLIGTAKLFGSLIAAGHIGLIVLKRLNFYQLQPKTKDWLDIMINTVLLECKSSSGNVEEDVSKLFSTVDSPELVMGLQYFLKKVTRKTNLAGSKKEKKKVKERCKMAQAALQAVMAADA